MMKSFKQFTPILAVLLFVVCLALHAEVRVTDVSVAQRWPWNGLVDITYSIESDDAEATFWVSFSGADLDQNRLVEMKSVTGATVGKVVKAGGPYTATWDAAQDEAEFHSSRFYVRVTVEETLYLIVDLSEGANASRYPIRYSAHGPDLSDDTCRTTELWLSRIPKGTFLMGSPEDELGRASDETLHSVTLTQDYYIGIFECTQRQYELVMGTRPSFFSNSSCYATRPVEQVSYNDLRGTGKGAQWPSSAEVDAGSFFGKLRAKTGLPFDLPTEAQWEYACRAGTATALNSGANLTSNDQPGEEIMYYGGIRYFYNNGGYGENSITACNWTTSAGTAKVGSYKYWANAWGLYDMHGNVAEWCLDWYGLYSLGTNVDPVGNASGTSRVCRGGGCNFNLSGSRSAARYPQKATGAGHSIGFELGSF